MNPTIISLNIILFHLLKCPLMKNVNFTMYISCSTDVVTVYSVYMCLHILHLQIILCYRFPKCLNKCKVRNFENVFIINDDSIMHANHNRLNKIILMHIAFMYRVTICTYQVCKVIPSFSHH